MLWLHYIGYNLHPGYHHVVVLLRSFDTLYLLYVQDLAIVPAQTIPIIIPIIIIINTTNIITITIIIIIIIKYTIFVVMMILTTFVFVTIDHALYEILAMDDLALADLIH